MSNPSPGGKRNGGGKGGSKTTGLEGEGTPGKKRVKLTYSSPIGGGVSKKKVNILKMHYEKHKCGAFRAWLVKSTVEEEPYWQPTKKKLVESAEARQQFMVFDLVPRRCPQTGGELPQKYASLYAWEQMLFYPEDDNMLIETWASHLRKKLNADLCNTAMGYKYEQQVQLGTNFTMENATVIQTALVDNHVLNIMRTSYGISNPEELNELVDNDLLTFFTTAASARAAIHNFLAGQDEDE
jgi:hypothetical protein